MGLSQSVQRYQRLRANLGGPLQFDPRRRQDIDFVFLGADARAGRLIKSQLKFHYSGDLPVYSTSFIYAMDGRSDFGSRRRSLADAPWVIAPPAWIADYPALYSQFWPSERRQARLHAMGYDAYHLVGALFNGSETGIEEVTGATGQLFMTTDGRIHRRPAWARFEGGHRFRFRMSTNFRKSCRTTDRLTPPFSKRRSRRPTIRKIRGDRAENRALKFLRKNGLSLIERNYRCRFGEIDLIMREPGGLVFVEVRCRGKNSFADPALTVDESKQARIRRTALSWLAARPALADETMRFDVVAMSTGSAIGGRVRIQWVRDAFRC